MARRLRLLWHATPSGQALLCSAADLPKHAGTLTDAMRFLAGYGFYLSLSTDRFVARVLDNLNTVAPQLLAGGFVPAKFDAAARFYCRVWCAG